MCINHISSVCVCTCWGGKNNPSHAAPPSSLFHNSGLMNMVVITFYLHHVCSSLCLVHYHRPWMLHPAILDVQDLVPHALTYWTNLSTGWELDILSLVVDLIHRCNDCSSSCTEGFHQPSFFGCLDDLLHAEGALTHCELTRLTSELEHGSSGHTWQDGTVSERCGD
jgi:hypothetical protein